MLGDAVQTAPGQEDRYRLHARWGSFPALTADTINQLEAVIPVSLEVSLKSPRYQCTQPCNEMSRPGNEMCQPPLVWTWRDKRPSLLNGAASELSPV